MGFVAMHARNSHCTSRTANVMHARSRYYIQARQPTYRHFEQGILAVERVFNADTIKQFVDQALAGQVLM